jgi:hypothetical protein
LGGLRGFIQGGCGAVRSQQGWGKAKHSKAKHSIAYQSLVLGQQDGNACIDLADGQGDQHRGFAGLHSGSPGVEEDRGKGCE